MKGFFSWFRNHTKMKRWFAIVLLGMILVCYGVAEILVAKEMTFLALAKVAIIFVVGFLCVVFAIVMIQKRTLELLVEASDLRLEQGNKQVNMNALIFNKKVYDKGPNIVVIGGGSGLNTVLRGLKNYTSNITAIVTVSDYGKLPSDSRKQLDLLPLEDVKESLIALSYDEQAMEALMTYEFQSRRIPLVSFGDLYLYAMKELYGDFTKSIEESKQILHMTGKVLPVTFDEIKICAELDNGMIVEEKEKIAQVVFEKVTKINRMYIQPSNCVPAPGVLEAIQNANAIVIGPGSLYTNVIPNLLVKNIAKAIKESKAIKMYVSNIMTEPGQTDNYSVSDHIKAILEYAGKGVIDYCIYDTGEIVPEYVRKYNREGKDLVEQDIQKCRDTGVKLLQRNLSTIIDDSIRHDPKAVAQAIIQIICDDLKYRDLQNDPQYLMLQSRLKEEKRFQKAKKPIYQTKKKTSTKTRSKHEKKHSKFQQKYQERIQSIQESDQKRIENRMKMKREEGKSYESRKGGKNFSK